LIITKPKPLRVIMFGLRIVVSRLVYPITKLEEDSRHAQWE